MSSGAPAALRRRREGQWERNGKTAIGVLSSPSTHTKDTHTHTHTHINIQNTHPHIHTHKAETE